MLFGPRSSRDNEEESMVRRAFLIAACSFFFLAPPALSSDLVTANARVSPPFPGEEAVLYFVIQNRGANARKIVGGSCTGCTGLEIRRDMLKDGAMVPAVLPEWEIPAGGSVAFVPRGLSIGLIGLSEISEGDLVSVELEFADGEKIAVEAEVLD